MNLLRYVCFISTFILINSIFDSKAIGIDPAQYKGKMVSISDCEIPDDELDKENYISHDMQVYKKNRQTTLLRANYSVPRKNGPIKTSVVLYEVINNSQRNKVVGFSDLQCDHYVVLAIVDLLHIGYTKDCYILPGEYSIDDFDFDTMTKFMYILWRVGRYSFQAEFEGPTGKIGCFYLVVDYIRIQKKNTNKKVQLIKGISNYNQSRHK